MKIKVYTEYLLKKLKVTLWVQNIYFYLNSIAFNVIILLFRSEDMTLEGFKRPGVIAMTVNLAGKNLTLKSDNKFTAQVILEME